MSDFKIEWREGSHGVESVAFISQEGRLTFRPSASLGAGTTEKPFDRAAALIAIRSLSEAILKRLAEGHHGDLT